MSFSSCFSSLFYFINICVASVVQVHRCSTARPTSQTLRPCSCYSTARGCSLTSAPSSTVCSAKLRNSHKKVPCPRGRILCFPSRPVGTSRADPHTFSHSCFTQWYKICHSFNGLRNLEAKSPFSGFSASQGLG